MATRVTVTKTQAPGSWCTDGTEITWTAADITNHTRFSMTGDDVLLVWNSHASDASTFTVNSVADAEGRTKDITTEAIAAGVVRVLGPFRNKTGWMQTGGYLHFTAAAADVKFAVIKLT